jgi:subtilisin
MHSSRSVSRRRTLELVAGSIAGGGLVGLAAGEEDDGDTVRVNVGYASAAAKRMAADRAAMVYYDHRIDVLTIEADRQAIADLRRRRDVRFIERDREYHAIAQTTPDGIKTVNAPAAHAASTTADGIDVAVIDTGIDRMHPDLADNLGAGRAFYGGVGAPVWDDDNGHGTHVAGTVGAIDNDEGVIGVGPDVTLHAVKVLNATGTGLASDIAAGIEWTVDQGFAVGNLSLGGGGTDTLREAVTFAEDNGTLLVAAAGNDGNCSDCISAPARYPECLAVSATTNRDTLASFSSTGPEVELAAPGNEVYSTSYLQDYATLSGTSMASPHVAGAAAAVVADGTDPLEARQRLKDTAVDIGLPATAMGAGRLDVAAALGL